MAKTHFSNFPGDITDNTKNAECTEENTDASDCVEPVISEVHSESLVKEEREEIEMRMEEESLIQGNRVKHPIKYRIISSLFFFDN